MRKKAWVYQVKSQVTRHGTDNASWHVGWIDPDLKRKTKSCGPGKRGLRDAEKLADTVHSQLVTGTYEKNKKKTWQEFFERYKEQIADGMDPESKRTALNSLKTFARIVAPTRMSSLDAMKVDEFISKRRKEKGRIATRISPATINRELRYLRAALRIVHDWEYIDKVPRIRLLKLPRKVPTFVPPDHFAAIYRACDVAKYPSGIPNIEAADWWAALIVTAYMTGWRIRQILALRWQDIDIDAGTAHSRAEDNKGRRDVTIPLHRVITEHFQKLTGSFDRNVFPWNLGRRKLWEQFWQIQQSAILPDGKPMPKCGKQGWYGFHDLRRGFATQNAQHMDLFELQTLMQHKSLETTRQYVNMVNRLNTVVERLYVPEVLRSAASM